MSPVRKALIAFGLFELVSITIAYSLGWADRPEAILKCLTEKGDG